MTILLDANLLLLFVVGLASRKYISTHKRLKSYSEEDYDLLQVMLARASKIIVTPNVLTETSNLAAQIGDPARTRIFQVLRAAIGSGKTTECYLDSRVAAARPEFLRLGLTDCGLLEIGAPGDLLLTADVQLWRAALANGKNAQTFNHVRNM